MKKRSTQEVRHDVAFYLAGVLIAVLSSFRDVPAVETILKVILPVLSLCIGIYLFYKILPEKWKNPNKVSLNGKSSKLVYWCLFVFYIVFAALVYLPALKDTPLAKDIVQFLYYGFWLCVGINVVVVLMPEKWKKPRE